MAVDREAEGAGALLGPEEDIDDDVLANLLSASWPSPAAAVLGTTTLVPRPAEVTS